MIDVARLPKLPECTLNYKNDQCETILEHMALVKLSPEALKTRQIVSMII